MTARSLLLALCAPTALGEELIPGARLIDAAVELGLALRFATSDRDVIVEVTPSRAGARHVARTTHLTFAYRGHGDDPLAMALCRAVAARVGDRDAEFLAALAALGDPAAARIREVEVDRVLEPSDGFDAISPYAGCLIGCRFCYAQERLATARAAHGLPIAPWGSWVDVRVNAAAVLAAELATRPRRPIKFCPIVSDPYHAVEARYRLTRACLTTIAAAAAPPPVLVLTRSRLIHRDLDVIARLPWIAVGVSLPTIDDGVRAHFEPRAATIDERLAILAAARAAGARPFAVVQPLLPGSIDALADALAAHVDSVSLDVLRGEGSAGPLFDDPRYAEARASGWQAARAAALRAALAARGVAVWDGELPPGVG